MRTLAATFLLLVAILAYGPRASAAELVMFEDAACSWCQKWHAEVGPGYPKSPEGQQAPLRRVDVRNQDSAGVALARPINATPTFVLVEGGEEIGRIVGYPGADFFYPRVEELLGRLPRAAPPRPTPGPSARETMCRALACREDRRVDVDARRLLGARHAA
jgi:hypothetical protein